MKTVMGSFELHCNENRLKWYYTLKVTAKISGFLYSSLSTFIFCTIPWLSFFTISVLIQNKYWYFHSWTFTQCTWTFQNLYHYWLKDVLFYMVAEYHLKTQSSCYFVICNCFNFIIFISDLTAGKCLIEIPFHREIQIKISLHFGCYIVSWLPSFLLFFLELSISAGSYRHIEAESVVPAIAPTWKIQDGSSWWLVKENLILKSWWKVSEWSILHNKRRRSHLSLTSVSLLKFQLLL